MLLGAAGAARRGGTAARTPAVQDGGPPIRTLAASTPSRRFGCRLRRPRFHTLPGLEPVGFCLARRRGATLSGDRVLVTPRPDPRRNRGEQFGLMVLSDDGRLLWYSPRPDKVHDLKVVTYRGRPMLAWFQHHRGSHGYYQLLDDRYRPAGRITPGHGFPTNLHELQVTPRGTAWVTADVRVRGGRITELVVQEIDIATGRVRFEWRSLRHVPAGDSYEARPRDGSSWDYFHGNSLAPPTAADPTLIVSSRNTSSLYGIDPATGRTRWILGGRRDQFHLPARWRFCAQHDVHRLPGGDVMLFDNGGTYMHGRPRCPVHPARALVFRIDAARRRVRLVRSISSVPLSASGKGWFPGWVGSARPMSNGDALVDWGPNRRITEIAPDGSVNLLLRVQRWSYRAMPARWTGRPAGAPAVATRRRGAVVDVWASWNGATEIRRWQVLAGPSADALEPAGPPAAFADLETHVAVRTDAPFVAVRALDGAGATLGQSRAVPAR